MFLVCCTSDQVTRVRVFNEEMYFHFIGEVFLYSFFSNLSRLFWLHMRVSWSISMRRDRIRALLSLPGSSFCKTLLWFSGYVRRPQVRYPAGISFFLVTCTYFITFFFTYWFNLHAYIFREQPLVSPPRTSEPLSPLGLYCIHRILSTYQLNAIWLYLDIRWVPFPSLKKQKLIAVVFISDDPP
jgi:hypothetical protein